MDQPFDQTTWKARVRAWWQEAARDLPGTFKRLGVRSAYGLLTASAWLPLLQAHVGQPGPAAAQLVDLIGSVGSNLVANLVQGVYDRQTAPRIEREVREDEALRAGHTRLVESLDALAAAQDALGEQWAAFLEDLRREDDALGGGLHIETGGMFVGGDLSNSGVVAGRNLSAQGDVIGTQIVLSGERALAAARTLLEGLSLEGPAARRARLQRAAEAYLRCLLDQHLYLQLKGLGVSDRVPLRLPLLELYVPLQARVQLPEGETWRRLQEEGDSEEPAEGLELAGRVLAGRLSAPRPVLDLLAENDGLIVLGDPGAGKTTFLKYLALKLALGQGAELGLEGRLPVLLPLSAYANALDARDVRLDAFIAGYLHDLGSDLPVGELLAQALGEGRALILLDGLDEVRQARLRHLVVERVVAFYVHHRAAGSKFVLTSRIVGYREVRPEAEGLAECTLVDLDQEEIADFVGRWTAALERQAGGEGEAAAREERELLQAVRANPGVRRLAANPLLLTILALMKRQGVTLPERRVELYDQYVRTLLSSWNRARGLGRPPARDLDVVQTVRVLAPLALWMHESSPGVGLVKRGAMQRKLVEIYAGLGEADPERAVGQFLADVREHAGLLLERGAGQYGFIHLTFEEYLAAVGIARLVQAGVGAVVETLARHVGEPPWREVSLLAVGYLGIVQQLEAVAGDVVRGLIQADSSAGEPGAATVLAGEAVLDAWPGGVTAQCKAGVEAALLRAMQDGAVAPALRRRAGLALGRLGWRPDDLDAFVEIQPGPFLYGEKKERRRIGHRYWIGKYPVTNAQYGRFVLDGGYERRAWWSDEGWAWRTGTYDSKVSDYLKDWLAQRPADRRHQPFWWDDLEWNNCLFPVVGVCWFEAEAYCNWLTEQVRSGVHALPLPEGYVARLPTEEEWERAVRGVDGRVYPWGDDLALDRLNLAEAWAGKLFQNDDEWLKWNPPGSAGTTAVCTYPQGVNGAGLWDGAGNVWEWTASWTDRDRDARVLRGGSWVISSRYARCASRGRDNPVIWDTYIGFRVSLSLAFADS